MKRRNADFGKIRGRKRKITEGSNTFLYLKFLMLWAVVITADFLLEFRFEFLWPFWLLLRSVHDSFKYKGLAFSVLFVCIALTSDLVCLFFIPVHWLFFAASTYVWVQYVWHTDKGICLPTIILWILFVYLEAAVRWKDSKNMPHLNLCRPFAAHCIGYPVVTLGFGFKSYVGYQIRQRKQREVAKENEFYMQLLQQALPPDEPAAAVTASSEQSSPQHQQLETGKSSHTLPTVAAQNSSGTAASTAPTAATSATNHNHSNKNAQTTSKLLSNNNLSNATSTTNSTSNGTIGASTPSSPAASAASTPNGYGNHAHQHNNKNHQHHHHRKSLEKEPKCDTTATTTTSNHQQQHNPHEHSSSSQTAGNHVKSSSSTASSASSSSKDKDGGYQKAQPHDSVDKHTSDKDNQHTTYSKAAGSVDAKVLQNGDGGHQYDQQVEEPVVVAAAATTTTTEKCRSGRKNRVKQKDAAPKENHHNNTQNDVASGAASLASSIVNKICESCARFEAEVKKLKSEMHTIRQIEMELRQKCESQASLKSCLQAKQKENDELQIKIQDLQNTRQLDRQNFQTIERRLGDERRQKQTLESQLTNERKFRKMAEEKVARAECSEACKLKSKQMEMELNKLRRELSLSVDAKHNAEKQSRNFEHELRKYEQDLRNRGEAQQNNEVLMSALTAMQDKNSTLEKNLSAETRVKLDLFSALGEAKRQLEIRENFIRNKDKEIMDMQAKIAQLLAVMPSIPSESSFNLSSGGGFDSPQLLPALHNNAQHQQQQQSQQHNHLPHQSNGNVSPIQQLQSAHSPTMSSMSSMSSMTSMLSSQNGMNGLSAAAAQQQQQQQQAAAVAAAVAAGQKLLDPNAPHYTPKNSSLIGD